MNLLNSAIWLFLIGLIWTVVIFFAFRKMIRQQINRDRRMLLGGFLLFIALAGIVVAGTVVFEHIESPEFCGTFCHVMEPYYDSYISPGNNQMMATHVKEEVSCSNCHNEPGIIGTIEGLVSAVPEMYLYVTNSYDPDDLHGDVSREACLKCHEYGVAKEPGDINAIGDITVNPHEDETKCRECHNPHIEGYGLTENACPVCHGASIDNFEDMLENHENRAGTDCMDCHNREHPTNAKIPFTEYPSLINDDFCSDCHRKDAERLNSGPHKLKFNCIDCHNEHATLSIEFDNCDGCHNPPSDHDTSTSSCSMCHDNTRIHLESAGDSGDSFSDLACSNCHDAENSAYESSFTSASLEIYGDNGCIDCHSDHNTKLYPHQKILPFDNCSGCHSTYNTASTVHDRTAISYLGFSGTTNDFCSDCHESEVERLSSGIHYERECIDCHGEHDTLRVDFDKCNICHDPPSGHDTSTTGCSNCHDDNKLLKIHSETGSDSGGSTPDETCLSCHDGNIGPLPPQEISTTLGTTANPHTGDKECNECHDTSKHKEGVYNGLTKDACTVCHGTTIDNFEDILSNHGDRMGAECTSCHNRDHPADARIPFSEYPSIINKDFCSDCHAEEVLRYQFEGHSSMECTICHEEHGTIRVEFNNCVDPPCHAPPSDHDTSLDSCLGSACHIDTSRIH